MVGKVEICRCLATLESDDFVPQLYRLFKFAQFPGLNGKLPDRLEITAAFLHLFQP